MKDIYTYAYASREVALRPPRRVPVMLAGAPTPSVVAVFKTHETGQGIPNEVWRRVTQ